MPPRAFKRDQIEANPEWEIEIVFGDNTGDGNGVFMDPVVIRNVETDGRIGIIMQVSNDALNRGEVMTEFLNNWLAEVVEALGVDPKGKLPTLWGALKSR
ncbi:MAG: hypothetical protein KatS3mg115_1346 [Candidatus Poribacteria bacterium]|nr:MAG: hypothetical protein KatS3mg115_1346 [Candidatus Poribacteria bacterium]